MALVFQPSNFSFGFSRQSAKHPNHHVYGPYRVQHIMADKNTQFQTKRGRGRPRGSRGLGGRGRNIGQPKDAFSTDGMTADEDTATGGSDPFVDVLSTLVLRPVESQSSSSERSPTRSKAAAVVKKGQLAFIETAIRFVSHEKATERGGLPPVVKDLWERHLHPTLDLSQFLPLGLEVSVLSLRFMPARRLLPQYMIMSILRYILIGAFSSLLLLMVCTMSI